MTSLSKITKYSKIYSDTYWGAFKLNDHLESTGIAQIIQNRNQFIEEYNIKKCVSHNKSINKYRKILDEEKTKTDHLEFYKTIDDNIIVINSPYMIEGSESENELLKTGWEKIEKLYFNEASTYIRRF